MILREYVKSVLNETYSIDAIVNDIADKIYKINEKHIHAIHYGKRSKASVNIKLLSNKYGLPEYDLDTAVGMGLMAGLSRNMEDIKAAIRPHIEKAYNEKMKEKTA